MGLPLRDLAVRTKHAHDGHVVIGAWGHISLMALLAYWNGLLTLSSANAMDGLCGAIFARQDRVIGLILERVLGRLAGVFQRGQNNLAHLRVDDLPHF